MMDLIDWETELSHCPYDDSVGIRIAKLAGDSQFSTYLTVIAPGRSVNPHYHKNGAEHYHILSGVGEITITDITSHHKEVMLVRKHYSFVVHANMLHQLKNTGAEPLMLMFSCPEDHLKADRYFL